MSDNPLYYSMLYYIISYYIMYSGVLPFLSLGGRFARATFLSECALFMVLYWLSFVFLDCFPFISLGGRPGGATVLGKRTLVMEYSVYVTIYINL